VPVREARRWPTAPFFGRGMRDSQRKRGVCAPASRAAASRCSASRRASRRGRAPFCVCFSKTPQTLRQRRGGCELFLKLAGTEVLTEVLKPRDVGPERLFDGVRVGGQDVAPEFVGA